MRWTASAPICYSVRVGAMAGATFSRNETNEERSDGLDTPEAARNLHRHGNQRLLRRDLIKG
jgi:hypothetical protein